MQLNSWNSFSICIFSDVQIYTYDNEPETTLKQIQNVLEMFQCFISVSFYMCERLKQNCFVSVLLCFSFTLSCTSALLTLASCYTAVLVTCLLLLCVTARRVGCCQEQSCLHGNTVETCWDSIYAPSQVCAPVHQEVAGYSRTHLIISSYYLRRRPSWE